MNKVACSKGFTLVEIMITLFILMIVGIMITAGLSSVIKTEDRIKQKRKNLAELQRAIFEIEQDMQQVITKPVITNEGKEQPTFILSNTAIELTRSGFVNPSIENSPNSLQRITYKLDGTHLFRIARKVTNKIPVNHAESRLLLNNVKSFHCTLVPAKNPLQYTQTQNVKTLKPNSKINMGIIIEINTAELGNIKRVIPFAINTIKENWDAVS